MITENIQPVAIPERQVVVPVGGIIPGNQTTPMRSLVKRRCADCGSPLAENECPDCNKVVTL